MYVGVCMWGSEKIKTFLKSANNYLCNTDEYFVLPGNILTNIRFMEIEIDKSFVFIKKSFSPLEYFISFFDKEERIKKYFPPQLPFSFSNLEKRFAQILKKINLLKSLSYHLQIEEMSYLFLHEQNKNALYIPSPKDLEKYSFNLQGTFYVKFSFRLYKFLLTKEPIVKNIYIDIYISYQMHCLI